MKKYLLPENGNFYKANLHCHSIYSDGMYSPEEIKELYKNKGYSIVAYTDHDIMIPHPELCDDDFLALNGFEVEITETVSEETPSYKKKNCHICYVALSPDNIVQPMWHRSKYQFGNARTHRDEVKFDETLPDYERVYSGEKITEMMQIGRDKGFYVTYNHPTWSLANYHDYMSFNSMNAMEIVNHECCELGYPEHNERVYDDMLRGGKRIYCVATDDNHKNVSRFFGGFTVIKAQKLEYKTITDALVAGDFYASEGPEIKNLWYEDGKVHIECSEAREIYIVKGVRRNVLIKAEECSLCEATFDIFPDDIYFRLVVVDYEGKKAYTNAYFVDELLNEEILNEE